MLLLVIMMSKKRKVEAKPKKMVVSAPKKVRLAIECTPEERKYMKMIAAHEEMTLNEFVLECVRQKIFECTRPHTPNKNTIQALKEAEKGEGLIQYDSIDDFLRSMEH